MSLTTVTKDQMNALKALSDTNLRVSEARALLTELEETETTYLVGREKRAVTRIAEALEESRDILRETKENYEQVQKFHETASSFADFLTKGREDFKQILSIFEEANVAFEASMDSFDKELAEQKQVLSIDRIKITNEQKSIENARKKLDEDTRVLLDKRGALERAIGRLKDKRI